MCLWTRSRVIMVSERHNYSSVGIAPALMYQRTNVSPLNTHTHIHTRTHSHTHTHTHMHALTHTRTRPHAHMHTHTHACTHTHTHGTHTQPVSTTTVDSAKSASSRKLKRHRIISRTSQVVRADLDFYNRSVTEIVYICTPTYMYAYKHTHINVPHTP